MADALTEIDLDAVQAAIVADVKAAFPDLATVEFDSEWRQGMPLPACLLEICEWLYFNDPDPGTGQQAVNARFEARIIINGVQTQASRQAIKRRAFAFSAFLYKRRWTDAAHPGKKLPTGPSEFLGAYPDDFHPELDQFTVWRIEWNQILHAGESVWVPGLPAPGTVSVSVQGDPPVQIYPELPPT